MMRFIETFLVLLLMVGYGVSLYDEARGLYIRKNCEDLTSQEWESLRKGVEAMKKLPMSDPRSWVYQSNIHGWSDFKKDPELNAKNHWTECQHGQFYFLPWHRAYIYFFEKLLRAASGDPNLSMCYWNYIDENQSKLPAAIRERTTKSGKPNTLYDDTRCHALNDGTGKIPARIADPTRALSMTEYALEKESPFEIITQKEHSFGGEIWDPVFEHRGFGSLEYLPHNQIHIYVGGHMSDLCKSGLDFVFWIHHSQVDRLWVTWLEAGNSNPTDDDTWMSQEFTFFDENGKEVTIQVQDFLDTEEDLGYTYDSTAADYVPKNPPSELILDDQITIASRKAHVKPIKRKKVDAVLIASLRDGALITEDQHTLAVPLNQQGLDIIKALHDGKIKKGEFRFAMLVNFTVQGVNTIYDVFIQRPEKCAPNEERYYYMSSISTLACAADPKQLRTSSANFDSTTNFEFFLTQPEEIMGNQLVVTFVPTNCDNLINPATLSLTNLQFFYGGPDPTDGQLKRKKKKSARQSSDLFDTLDPNTIFSQISNQLMNVVETVLDLIPGFIPV